MSLPKVLIIGQPFNNDTGGGITLSNLFNGWDRDKLAVACSGYSLHDNIDTEVCNTYYQLGYKEQKWRFPFNYLQRKYSSGLIKFDGKTIQNLTITKSKLRVKIIMDFFIPFLKYIGLIHYIYKTGLSVDFCNWLDDFNPDVIYDQTAFRDDILFCISVHSYLKKPLIFHMMDDWPSTISYKGLFKKYWQNKIDHEFRDLLNRAAVLMSISEEMSNEYKIRYNKDFIPFHNTIDIDFWQKHQRNNYELNESPTILYAGRVGLGIEKSLELFAKAIQRVNEELEISIKFILQTQEKPLWVKNYKNVVYNNFVPYNDLPKIFSETDFLLLPYDFSPLSIKYIRYSMPTKAPEYMVSGTPIIIFAPEVTAIVKYAKKYEWAEVITENNISEISGAIKHLIESKELRQYIAQNAIKIAEKNHNSIEVTDNFKEVICSLVNES
ncbi:MAG TPA: glycosyltransferase [Candidatus Paceibacterota bacterium]